MGPRKGWLRASVVGGLAVVAAAGCGMTRLQTARTVAPGTTQTTLASGLVHNQLAPFGERKHVPEIPIEVMVRHGATAQLDWGVRTFLGLGVLGDAKWNLLDHAWPTALALSGGLGAAVSGNSGLDTTAKIASVPVAVTASHTVIPGLTPYGAVSYSAYWIFDYGTSPPHPAPRSGTGDGVLGLHVGVELAAASGRALLLEYTYARPVVDDPGDNYLFATNQFFMIGFHTR